MFRPNKILFIVTLIRGTTIAISSSSWFIRWLGLELNLLSFIPFIFSEKNSYSSERALKYFLIQAMGSAVILIRATTLILNQAFPEKLILLSLLLKIGAAPLHFWLPAIIQGLSWGGCLVLMTLQKIAPIGILLYTVSSSVRGLWVGASLLSAILGGLGGLNQTLIRKILAYSSIRHMGWILAALSFDRAQWKFYLIVYSFTSLSLILVLNNTQIYHTTQLLNLRNSPVNIIGVFLTLFSLGGLPPLLGFLPKLRVIRELTWHGSLIWLFVLTMRSLITLYFYTRLLIICLTLKRPKVSSVPIKFNLTVGLVTLLNILLLYVPLYY